MALQRKQAKGPAKPPKGARCQEASPQSKDTYIPCLQPATQIIANRDPHAYMMCSACADHNVRNRGARIVMEGEKVKIWDGVVPEPKIPDEPKAPRLKEGKPEIGERLQNYIEQGCASVKGKLIDKDGKPTTMLAPLLEPDLTAATMAQYAVALRAAKDAWEEAGEIITKAYAKLALELVPAAFEREKISSFTTTNGYRVTVQERYFASIKAEALATIYKVLCPTKPELDCTWCSMAEAEAAAKRLPAKTPHSIISEQVPGKVAAYIWLRTHGLDALIVETVNASTLSAAGKAMIETEGRELPEALFNAHYTPNTSITKVKK